MFNKIKEYFKLVKKSKHYLDNLDYGSLKVLYNDLSNFYSDENYPFENLGVGGEVQMKTKYEPKHKAVFIAFECSSGNRKEHKGIFKKINFDWFTNFFYFPNRSIRMCKRTRTYNDSALKIYSHTGFTLSFKSIEEAMHNRVDDLMKKNDVKTICVYGWSYGGAMTTLAHENLWYKYEQKKNIPVTSFAIGAPRVYFKPIFRFWLLPHWYKLKARYEHFYSIQNNNDMVPHCPPAITGSCHIVKRIRVGDRFNLIKFFKPNIYHQKNEYDKLFNNLCEVNENL